MTSLGVFSALPEGYGDRIAVDGPRTVAVAPGGQLWLWDGDRLVWHGAADTPTWGRPVLGRRLSYGLGHVDGDRYVPAVAPQRGGFPGPTRPDGAEWDAAGQRLVVWYGQSIIEIVGGREVPLGDVTGRIDTVWVTPDAVWTVGDQVTRPGRIGQKAHEMPVLAVDGTESKLLTVDGARAILWDLATGEPGPELLAFNNGGALSPDGRVAVLFEGARLRVYCVEGTSLRHDADLPIPAGMRGVALGLDRLVASFADRPWIRTAAFTSACR